MLEWTEPFHSEPTSVQLLTLVSVAPCRRVAAHHQAQAVVPVWRVGGEVRLVTWRRRPLHPLPPAYVGDGAWEEGHCQWMPQSPLDQLIAPVFRHPLFLFLLTRDKHHPYVETCGITGAGEHLRWRRFLSLDQSHTSVVLLIGVGILRNPIIFPERNVHNQGYEDNMTGTVFRSIYRFKDECSPLLHQESIRSLFIFQILDTVLCRWQLLITSMMWKQS